MDYNHLQHHGVKGQRWGVRRYQNKDGSLTSAGKKRRSTSEVVKDASKYIKDRRARIKEENERRAAEQRKQDIIDGKIKSKDMTDDELKERIERLRLEESYNRISNNNQAEIDKGKSFVKEYAGQAAKKILLDTAVDVTAQVVKTAFVDVANEGINKSKFKKKERDKDLSDDELKKLAEEEFKEFVFANNKKKS